MRVAVIGAGISGLTTARALAARLGPGSVEVFEAGARPGGHARTVEIATPRGPLAVDVGFIVCNRERYPHFFAMLAELGVATQPTTMSFSVRSPDGSFEMGSAGAAALFAQRSNLFRPAHWRFLAAIVVHLRQARRALRDGTATEATLGAWLSASGAPADVRDRFVVPLAASLWSLAADRVVDFPAETYLRFMDQHGMLRPTRPLAWHTIVGGSQTYVRALVTALAAPIHCGVAVRRVIRRNDGIELELAAGAPRDLAPRFDRVVLACHADVALALLDRPRDDEVRVLGAFSYSRNPTWLHSDASYLPRRAAARASWNYVLDPDRSRVAVTYWMNRLQQLPTELTGDTPYLVTLHPRAPLAPDLVHHRVDFDHPLFDFAARRAQAELGAIQGAGGVYHCGAHLGYGFHEDGVRSGLAAAARVLADDAGATAGHRAGS